MKIPSYFKSLFKSKVQKLHKKNLELNDLLAEYCQRNVDLKNENDQLTKSMSELYLENLELKKEVEKLSDDVMKQIYLEHKQLKEFCDMNS